MTGQNSKVERTPKHLRARGQLLQPLGLSSRRFSHVVGGQHRRSRGIAGAQPFQCDRGHCWREPHGSSLRAYHLQHLQGSDGLEHIILKSTAFALIVELVVQCFLDVGIHSFRLVVWDRNITRLL
jgi:hypothetical protein